VKIHLTTAQLGTPWPSSWLARPKHNVWGARLAHVPWLWPIRTSCKAGPTLIMWRGEPFCHVWCPSVHPVGKSPFNPLQLLSLRFTFFIYKIDFPSEKKFTKLIVWLPSTYKTVCFCILVCFDSDFADVAPRFHVQNFRTELYVISVPDYVFWPSKEYEVITLHLWAIIGYESKVLQKWNLVF
jgi:hypothetical protein